MKRFFILFAAVALVAASCGKSTTTVNPGGGAPTVTTTGPTNGATDVQRNVTVTATFSAAMDPATINAASFQLKNGGIAIPAAVTYINGVALLAPSVLLNPGAIFTASISTAAKNMAGTPLASTKTWTFTTLAASGVGPGAVNLGSAGNFVILAKSGISTTGTTVIVGDLGLSPTAASGISGFSLSAPPSSFSTSPLVTGRVYASDYAPPTPANLTSAVLDMQTAYTDAAGRTLPDFTELGAGNISGLTLVPGLYKWGTGVNIPSSVTLSGSATSVWIFQIAQNLTVGNGVSVNLTGGALARNIFWQVGGSATLGTTSSFQGTILCQTLIAMNTGSTLVGRALAQTAVTLAAAHVTISSGPAFVRNDGVAALARKPRP